MTDSTTDRPQDADLSVASEPAIGSVTDAASATHTDSTTNTDSADSTDSATDATDATDATNATNATNATSDWAAALAEQNATQNASPAPMTQADGLDDWASAMAKQQAASQAAGQSQPAAAPASAKPTPLFQPLTGTDSGQSADIDLIMDVPVQLTVELGRSRMTIKNLLQLGQGSVVELNGLAGEPMDIYVNGYLIAQGEVVVVEDHYGIRLTDIITPSERINRLNNRR